MKQNFSIGETARLNKISIQTLRYYDKIGIFKPHYIDPESGYRYYHIKQFFYLDIIKYLKYVRTPLEDIKCIIECNPEHMKSFLEEQESVIDEEIKKLECSKRLLERRKYQLTEQLDICSQNDRGSIYTRSIEQQTILKADTPQINPHQQSDMYFRKLAEVLEERGELIDNYYGYIYDLKDFNESDGIICNSVYTTTCVGEKIGLDNDIHLDIIPKGEYVCIAFDWSEENYYSYYQKLYRYIKTNNISTDGNVYQISLPINYNSLSKEQFLTEIRVRKQH